MFVFIAGQIIFFDVHARYVVDKASSAIPYANLAITLAVAGTTTNKSAHLASSICLTLKSFSFTSEKTSVYTGFFERLKKVNFETNSKDACV